MIGPMANFLGRKVETIKGKPTPNCPQTGDVMTAPFAARVPRGREPRRRAHASGSATRARRSRSRSCPASHDSTVPRALLSEPERKNLEPDNVSLQLGPPSGYVIRFTNGLTVYLSGDTGMHAEMKTVVNEFHKANLMVLNLGLSAVNAPAAAYIANDLVQPAYGDRVARQRRRRPAAAS